MAESFYEGSVSYAVAPPRCEMCGALLVGNDTDHKNHHDALESLRMIADLWLWDAVACQAVLARLVDPDASYAQIGKLAGVSKQAVGKAITRMEATYPQVGYFVRAHGPAAIAQKKRRRDAIN
jgi:hypothetical protein